MTDVTIHLRTQIEDAEPDQEIFINATSVEVCPHNGCVEFFNPLMGEHDTIDMDADGFTYAGVKYDFMFVRGEGE